MPGFLHQTSPASHSSRTPPPPWADHQPQPPQRPEDSLLKTLHKYAHPHVPSATLTQPSWPPQRPFQGTPLSGGGGGGHRDGGRGARGTGRTHSTCQTPAVLRHHHIPRPPPPRSDWWHSVMGRPVVHLLGGGGFQRPPYGTVRHTFSLAHGGGGRTPGGLCLISHPLTEAPFQQHPPHPPSTWGTGGGGAAMPPHPHSTAPHYTRPPQSPPTHIHPLPPLPLGTEVL